MNVNQLATYANIKHRQFIYSSWLYYLLPALIIPLMAYAFKESWLLVGVPVFYLGRLVPKNLWIIITVAFTLFAFKNGLDIKNYSTFFFMCLFYGFLLYEIPKNSRLAELNIKEELANQTDKDIEKLLSNSRNLQKKINNLYAVLN